jgi:hypothetical protein
VSIAAVIRCSARSPPVAISFSVRHTVGTDAVGPNSSAWSLIIRKSLITAAVASAQHRRIHMPTGGVTGSVRRAPFSTEIGEVHELPRSG